MIRRGATRNINSDQAAVGFGFKCRREATGKSAADEGNEPFRKIADYRRKSDLPIANLHAQFCLRMQW